MSEEIWRDIPGYENLYQVSNMGRVKSLSRKIRTKNNSFRVLPETICILHKNRGGYLQINLYKEGGYKTYTVHRLVGMTFIPNPDNLPQINHKDEDKTNNRVENLEYCSSSYNNRYGTKLERMKSNINFKSSHLKQRVTLGKPVNQYLIDGKLINTFQSTMEAYRVTGVRTQGICACANHRPYYHTAGGYKWEWVN